MVSTTGGGSWHQGRHSCQHQFNLQGPKGANVMCNSLYEWYMHRNENCRWKVENFIRDVSGPPVRSIVSGDASISVTINGEDRINASCRSFNESV